MRRLLSREWVLSGLLFAFGGAYLGFLFADFGAIVRGIYLNADVAAAPVIGQLYGEAPNSASVVLGFLPWYTTLWFELATRHVPFHAELWEVAPWVASVAGIAAVAWATAKAAGRWASALVAFVLVCAGPALLKVQFAFDYHGATAVDVCFLDAFLVLLVTRRGRIGGRLFHLLLCGFVTAVTAAGVASDNLLVLAGLIPFLAAGLVVTLLVPRAIGQRVALTVVGVGALSVVGAQIVTSAMHSQHVYAAQRRTIFAPWDQITPNIRKTVESIASLFNADFGGAAVGWRSLLAFASAFVLACAVVFASRATRSWCAEVRLHLHTRSVDASASSAARAVQLTYWPVSAAMPVLASVLSSVPDMNTGRYFISAAYGVPVVAAVTLARNGFRRRLIATAGACVLALGSAVALATRDIQSNQGHYPTNDFASFLHTFALVEGLKYGYAAYWVAVPLTWETRGQVEVYPTLQCRSPFGLCTYPLHEISSWYAPRASTRTFLVVDPRYGPGDPGTKLGGPEKVVSYGEDTIYVYGYDIAANFGDWRRYPAAS
jgi:hypothetical protein